MRTLKIALISMALIVLTVTATGCCCPFDLSSLLSGAEFTAGDFSDVPEYPGSTQSTESNEALGIMAGVFSLISSDAEWKHYQTSDSESSVTTWYRSNLPGYGWTEVTGEDLGTTETEGSLFFENTTDSELVLIIFAVSGLEESSNLTDVVVGRMHITAAGE